MVPTDREPGTGYCWNGFLGPFTHRWFHSGIKKKGSRDDEFHYHDRVMSETPAFGAGASQFVCKLVEFRNSHGQDLPRT